MFASKPKQLIQIVLLGIALSWNPACAPVHVEPQIAIEYLRKHTVWYFDGEKTHELEGIDKLVVTPAGRDRLSFAIDTVANNGHTCSMHGVASRLGDHFEFREPVDLDLDLTDGDSLECVLELRVADQQIELRDVNHNCRLYYCGMRAKLDGLIFLRVTAGQTSEAQPVEPKEDAVLAIPGSVLKLDPGFGCAEKVDELPIPTRQGGYFLYISDIARHLTFKIHEVCLGNPKGPDVKQDFKWFMISGVPVKNPRAGCQLPPGLVLSLYPTGEKQPDLRPTEIYSSSDVVRYPKDGIVIGQHDDQLRWLETTGRCIVDWSLIEKLPKFAIFGLKNHRTQKNKSFKWHEKIYDCADPEQIAPPGFRRVFLYDYCWLEKTTGPDILSESF